jgi:hypothetical protein
MKKTYKMDYQLQAGITVEVDHQLMTEKELHEINNFWSGSKSRLRNAKGSVLHAVLKMLCRGTLYIQLTNDYNLYGVVNEYDWKDGNGVEGWPNMDGSEGIKITAIEEFCFDSDEVDVEELAKAQN